MELRVADNPNKARYEITVLSDNGDSEIAGFVVYHLTGNAISLVHTETDPRFRGHGVGGQLIKATLDSARERGLEVLPYCPFVRSWIEEHPEYADLVPATRRAEFGL
jgi:predicted GNAT family acetyltransferase